MDITISPINKLNGEVIAPPSKSYSHRAFIVASLADGVSVIKNPLTSGDVEVTINVLKSLGINILKGVENSYVVQKTADSFKSVKKSIPMIIVGNKTDLERQVERSEAEDLVKRLNCYDYLETSAKTGENVEQAFKKIAKACLESVKEE